MDQHEIDRIGAEIARRAQSDRSLPTAAELRSDMRDEIARLRAIEKRPATWQRRLTAASWCASIAASRRRRPIWTTPANCMPRWGWRKSRKHDHHARRQRLGPWPH